MLIHTFGAYFGLATSAWFYNKKISEVKEKKTPSYHSDLFSFFGTLFLWLFWPSFNSALAHGDERYRGVINTYFALCSCTLTTALVSALVSGEDKFEMEHFQNAALAGAVGVGAVADLQIHPWGAMIIGIVAGMVSVLGFRYITPRLNRYIYDTCGVHNLHGMPGVLSGIASIIVARSLEYDVVGDSLYNTYPMRAPKSENGKEWSATHQSLMQLAALGTTIGLALVGGFFTGMFLRLPIWNQPDTEELFEDDMWWEVPEEGYKQLSGATPNNHYQDNYRVKYEENGLQQSHF
jgi:ammonium transporter Rh